MSSRSSTTLPSINSFAMVGHLPFANDAPYLAAPCLPLSLPLCMSQLFHPLFICLSTLFPLSSFSCPPPPPHNCFLRNTGWVFNEKLWNSRLFGICVPDISKIPRGGLSQLCYSRSTSRWIGFTTWLLLQAWVQTSAFQQWRFQILRGAGTILWVHPTTLAPVNAVDVLTPHCLILFTSHACAIPPQQYLFHTFSQLLIFSIILVSLSPLSFSSSLQS